MRSATFDHSHDAAQNAWVAPGLLQRKCACGTHSAQGQCTGCAEKKALLQRHGNGKSKSITAPPIINEVLRSTGHPLDISTRNFFEPQFGQDFSHVRIHADSRAAESARAVNALAYTVGRDIVFGSGKYQPYTRDGLRMVAHELTHTLQQSSLSGTHSTALQVSGTDSAEEREADSVASHIDASQGVGNAAVGVSRLPVSQVQRSPQPATTKSAKPSCPNVTPDSSPDDFKAAACARPLPPDTPEECELTQAQTIALKSAQRLAASRVEGATLRIGTKEGETYAADLASRLFISDAPSVDDIKKILKKVGPFLSGTGVQFEGRTCADADCQHISTLAFVRATGTLPIFICPVTFTGTQELYRTVMHEALHWAGITVPDRTKVPEIYCEKYDCQAACGTSDIADAWMHYISCLGERPVLRPKGHPQHGQTRVSE
jgi:Domain of unknown function (DUF4157)